MFSIVARDELWTLGPEPYLREKRLWHGRATLAGVEIRADDTADEDLLLRCDQEMEAALAGLPRLDAALVARVVVSVRRAAGSIRTEATIAVSAGSLSLVTTPEVVAADCAQLLHIGAVLPEIETGYRGIPILWRNGSAAVLLHEAAGHPAEHRLQPIAWPAWITVRDEPRFDVDDTGLPAAPADLLRGEQLGTMRRASFADVPLPRLSNVVVRHENAPFDLPARRIEVLLVAGGRYDPLTDDITLFVSTADMIDGGVTRRVEPFVITESRESVSRALRGAHGEPLRYPGVICSSEGQEIPVSSHAPLLVTVF